MEHIRGFFGGVGVESGDDDDFAVVVHQHGVFPAGFFGRRGFAVYGQYLELGLVRVEYVLAVAGG